MYLGDGEIGWLRALFQLRGTVLPRIAPRIAGVTTFALSLTLLHEFGIRGLVTLTATPFMLIGLPLGIFLGFRNNASHDRFWEARKLWGALVNTTRTAARQYLLYIGPQRDGVPTTPISDEDSAALTECRRTLVLRTVAFAHALRLSLRGEDVTPLTAFLSEAEVEQLRLERNVPTAICYRTGEELVALWRRGWIHPLHLPMFEGTLTALTDIHGACERIKNTPIPYSYIALIHRLVALYCLLLPLGLIDTLHGYTPIAVALVSYALFGLDAIGDEVEEPFGTDVNDLPLLQLSTAIEANLRQRLGDSALPAPVEPVDGVLS